MRVVERRCMITARSLAYLNDRTKANESATAAIAAVVAIDCACRSLARSFARSLTRSFVRLGSRSATRLSQRCIYNLVRTDTIRSRMSCSWDCEFHEAVDTTKSRAVRTARRSHDECRNAKVEHTSHTAMLKAVLLTYMYM